MSDLLWEGVNLMVIGMGAVAVFLVLLVFATSAMSAIVTKYLPDPEPPVISQQPTAQSPAKANDGQLLAVIAAAIHRHRSRHK